MTQFQVPIDATHVRVISCTVNGAGGFMVPAYCGGDCETEACEETDWYDPDWYPILQIENSEPTNALLPAIMQARKLARYCCLPCAD